MPKEAKTKASEKKEENQRHSTSKKWERAPGRASSGMRKRHSKVMRATRRHVRREVGTGIRLPAYYDEVAVSCGCEVA